MAQRVPAVVVLPAAVNFIYIHPTTVASITDHLTLSTLLEQYKLNYPISCETSSGGYFV